MLKILLFQLMVFAFFSGCTKNPLCKTKSGNQGIIVDYYTKKESCIYSTKHQFLIRNNSELKSTLYVDSVHHKQYCSTTSLPEVDFSQYSILGLRASTNGGGDFLRTALRNDSEKRIYYEVYPNTCTNTKDLRVTYNMVVIPKVPDDYTVEFTVKEN